MEKNKSLQEIKKIIQDSFKSSLSRREFCRERKIPIQTFYSWLKKYSDLKENKLNFVSLAVEDKVVPQNTKINNVEKIILKTLSGITLEMTSSISTSWLSSLLKEMA